MAMILGLANWGNTNWSNNWGSLSQNPSWQLPAPKYPALAGLSGMSLAGGLPIAQDLLMIPQGVQSIAQQLLQNLPLPGNAFGFNPGGPLQPGLLQAGLLQPGLLQPGLFQPNLFQNAFQSPFQTPFQIGLPGLGLGNNPLWDDNSLQRQQDIQTLGTILLQNGLSLGTLVNAAAATAKSSGTALSPTVFQTTLSGATAGLSSDQQNLITTELQNLANDGAPQLVQALWGSAGSASSTGTSSGSSSGTSADSTAIDAFGISGLNATTAQGASDLNTLDGDLQNDGINLGNLIQSAFTTAYNGLSSSKQSAITTDLNNVKNDGISLPLNSTTATGTPSGTAAAVSAFGISGLEASTGQGATDLAKLDSDLKADGVTLSSLIQNAFSTAYKGLSAADQSAISDDLASIKSDGITLPLATS